MHLFMGFMYVFIFFVFKCSGWLCFRVACAPHVLTGSSFGGGCAAALDSLAGVAMERLKLYKWLNFCCSCFSLRISSAVWLST